MIAAKAIKTSDIHTSEGRLRVVKPDYVNLFAMSLVDDRVLPAIKVRRTPNGDGKFTLISGAHRLEAYKLAGIEELMLGEQVQIIKVDKDQAREQEIEENLFRNELTALERIDTIYEYRRMFEIKFGIIKPTGGDRRSLGFQKCQDGTFEIDGKKVNLFGLAEDSQEGDFYSNVAERLGLSARTGKRLCSIAKHLTVELHDALIGSTAEDNQSVIERLSKVTPAEQKKLAKLIIERTAGDVDAAEKILFAAPKTNEKQKRLNAVLNNIGALGKKDRRHALQVLFQTYDGDAKWALENPLEASK